MRVPITKLRVTILRPAIAGLLLAGLCMSVGCNDSPTALENGTERTSGETGEQTDDDDPVVNVPVVLSEAVERPGSVAGISGAVLQSADPVAYVSFAAGTFSRADRVRIVNTRNNLLANGTVIDGGLDPVAVPAMEGDTLDVTVFQQALPLIHLRRPVPRRRPPVVIRTRPASGETAVPLNCTIVVVFSEPVEASSVDSGVRLLRDGARVAAEALLDPDGLSVLLRPLEDLNGESDYVLSISSDVADLSGDPLEEEKVVGFRTDDGIPGSATTIQVGPDTTFLEVGDLSTLRVVDENETPLQAMVLSWESLDPLVASVYSNGSVRGTGEGTTSIVVTFGTLADTVSVVVGAVTDFGSVTAGGSHSCMLSSDGEASCWGSNERGQLGIDMSIPESTEPVSVDTALRFRDLSAGEAHTCGIDMEHRLWCWGGNWRQQLGVGGGSDTNRPIHVLPGGAFIEVSAGDAHTCAIDELGAAWCWGDNSQGQLGIGTSVTARSPQRVSGGHLFIAVSTGAATTCAVATDGLGYCWGENRFGQLSDRLLGMNSFVPVSATDDLEWGDIHGVIGVAAGQRHTCRVFSDGHQWCSGRTVVDAIELDGQGGVLYCGGSPSFCPWAALIVYPQSESYVDATAGSEHGCSLTSNGQVLCWGNANYGQRGDGNISELRTWLPPARPVSGGPYRAVDAGAWHTCAMDEAGEVYCWGRNDHGQLGIGNHLTQARPVHVGR